MGHPRWLIKSVGVGILMNFYGMGSKGMLQVMILIDLFLACIRAH